MAKRTKNQLLAITFGRKEIGYTATEYKNAVSRCLKTHVQRKINDVRICKTGKLSPGESGFTAEGRTSETNLHIVFFTL